MLPCMPLPCLVSPSLLRFSPLSPSLSLSHSAWGPAQLAAAKHVDVEELDLIMVPGVAFDRRGGRSGHGMGYYDKLLEHARPDTPLVALAFECQLFEEVPTAEHDVYMDKVVTEAAVYQGRGRS